MNCKGLITLSHSSDSGEVVVDHGDVEDVDHGVDEAQTVVHTAAAALSVDDAVHVVAPGVGGVEDVAYLLALTYLALSLPFLYFDVQQTVREN